VKRHASHGSAILSGSGNEVLRLAEEIARTHHEWWDGSGYPSGLRRTSIPISGRIVALADVFDALTHERPYKQAWPVEQAVEEVQSLRGRQFDPDAVDAFQRLDPYDVAGKQSATETSRRILRIVA
jgi:putative two-component system response regulator